MNLLNLAVKIFADDQASDKIPGIASNITGGLGKAVAGVAKIGAAATAAAAGAAVAIGTAAVNSYAEQEQMWGGVQKLYGAAGMSLEEYAQSVGQSVDEAKGKYDELRQAEGLVAQNAQQAFKTAGMSSNEYMETATQFSASLIDSLGGDTVEAARQTDVAMRAISDNVNTFGSDMGSVSDAFKGFSKQNYTMLDNLKLGYGGTKEEMERLIADANEWGAANGKASDLSIDSFSDVVTAIEQIQEKQGIAGTTAREAATTIEGSINMTKGAWANLLTEMGKEDGDIGARMEELMDSAITVLIGATDENGNKLSTGILGRVSTIIQNVSQAIPTMMPKIQEALSQALPQVLQIITDVLPILLQLVGTLFSSVGSVLPGLFQTILPVLVEQLIMVIGTLTDNIPAMLDAAGQLIMTIASAIVEYGPQILAALVTFVGTLVQELINRGPEMLEGAKQLFAKAKEGFEEYWPQIQQWFSELPQKILDAIGDLGSLLFDAGSNIIQGFLDGLGSKWEDVKGWFGGLTENIPDWKGPRERDRRLLTSNGRLIMQSLTDGLERGIPMVEDTLSGITDRLQTGISTNYSVASAGASNTDAAMLQALGAIRDNMNLSVYLDGNTLVGGIAPRMNTAMGRL